MLDAVAAAIDELCEVDLDALSDGELDDAVVALQTQLSRLEAVTTKVTARWDARRCWEAARARSGASWLMWKCHLQENVARRRVRLGRVLRHLPVTEAAWLAGEITGSHVAALAGGHSPATEALLARDEQQLVDAARQMRFSWFARVVGYWRQVAAPDEVEAQADRDWIARRFDLSQSYRGVWFGDIQLDAPSGMAVATVLRAIDTEFFEADWRAAQALHGDDTTLEHLARTPTQRRADALVEMARRAATTPKNGQAPAPLFSVFVGYETFKGRICELANGSVTAPGAVARWLDGADVERIVFDTPSRVIDVGRAQRVYRGAGRRAVEVRDRECFHETCEETIDRMEIDHVLPWAAGGETTEANGRLGCGWHNRDRHRRPRPPP